MPLVSVLCPTYDRGPALRATIDSVRAQTLSDLELIVVSDGSTDDTDDVVLEAAREDSRVRLTRIDHFGHPSRALNVGLTQASGEFIAYLDHDDFWSAEHLATVLEPLQRGADIAATGSVWIDADQRVLSVRPTASLFWHHEIQVVNPVFENSQAAHRAEWSQRVGPWREDPFGLEDWDRWLRFADEGARFQTVERRTVRKTMSTGNRHRSLPRRHAVELATFPDAASARRGLAVLGQPSAAEELAAAAEADTRAWYDRLARSDDFVFPTGFADSRATALAALPAALAEARAADRGWEDPVDIRLAPLHGRVSLLQGVGCMTAEHTARYAASLRTAQPRFLEVVARRIAPFDGRLPDDGVPAPVETGPR